MSLLLPDGYPVPLLVSFAHQHGIKVSDNVSGQELLTLLQPQWRRQTQHQFQIPGGPPTDQAWTSLAALGLVDEVQAPRGEYTGAFVLGGTLLATRKRLSHLVKENCDGLKVIWIYLFGSCRALDPVKEGPKELCTPAELAFRREWRAPNSLPTTEADMMYFVFNQSDLPRDWICVLVDTPRQNEPEGKSRNPNTTDTARRFLDYYGQRFGTYLVVSSQPYVARQTINVRQVLPETFSVVGTGYAASRSTPLGTFLDEIVNLLYVEVEATR